MAHFYEKDITWTTEAARPGTSVMPGHWYAASVRTRICGEVKADDGHVMRHSLPLGVWPEKIGSHLDAEMEASKLRARIVDMLNADHADRMARIAGEAA